MNFFPTLLQSLQFMRFNLSADRTQPTLNLLSNIKVEEDNTPLTSLYSMTQQELLQRHLADSAQRNVQQPLQPLDQELPKITSKKMQSVQIYKRSKKTNTCGHPEKEHYAKGMCNNCYHRLGRNKQPWLCSHKKLYAQGLCQNCYINQYNKKRRVESQEQPNAQELLPQEP